jgi:hypothetical protein
MGTSKSNDGPGDRTPLLPDWAQDPTVPDVPGEQPPPDNPPEVPPDVGDDGVAPPIPHPAPEPPQPRPDVTPRPWQRAKADLTRFVRTGSRDDLASAGRSYVKARGGARSAANASRAGQSSAGRAINFLSTVAMGGIAEALERIGIREILGRRVESVLAAILDKLAPAGAGKDESAARQAIDRTLVMLFEEYSVEADGLDRLDEMDSEAVEGAFSLLVAEYNFQRWMMELGKRIEEGAVSASEALELEKFARECIVEATKLDLRGHDILTTDWTEPNNRKVIEDIYEQAYVFLEDL